MTPERARMPVIALRMGIWEVGLKATNIEGQISVYLLLRHNSVTHREYGHGTGNRISRNEVRCIRNAPSARCRTERKGSSC